MDNDRIHGLLSAKLVELTERARRIEADLREPLDDDSAEQATAREDDESLDAIERSVLAEISHVRDALARLANGRYGVCLSCGGAIASARLDAMPEAALCIACASRV